MRDSNFKLCFNRHYLSDVFQVVVTSWSFILMFLELIPASPQLDTFCWKFFTLQENLTSFCSPGLLWRSREELSMAVSAEMGAKLYTRKQNILCYYFVIKCLLLINTFTQLKRKQKMRFHKRVLSLLKYVAKMNDFNFTLSARIICTLSKWSCNSNAPHSSNVFQTSYFLWQFDSKHETLSENNVISHI